MELVWKDLEMVIEYDESIKVLGVDMECLDTPWSDRSTITVKDIYDYVANGPSHFSAVYNLLQMYRLIDKSDFVGNYFPKCYLIRFEGDNDQFVLNMAMSNLVKKGYMSSAMFGKMYHKYCVKDYGCVFCGKKNFRDMLSFKYFGNDIVKFEVKVGINPVTVVIEGECECFKQEEKNQDDEFVEEDVREDEVGVDDHVVMVVVNSVLSHHKVKVDDFSVSDAIASLTGSIILTRDRKKFFSNDLAICQVPMSDNYGGIVYTWLNHRYLVKGVRLRQPFVLLESGISFVDKITPDRTYLVDSEVSKQYVEGFKKDGYSLKTTCQPGKGVTGFISSKFSLGCDEYVDLYSGKMVKYKTFPVMQYMVVTPLSFISFPTYTKYVDNEKRPMKVVFVRESCFIRYRENKIVIVVKHGKDVIGDIGNEYQFIGVT